MLAAGPSGPVFVCGVAHRPLAPPLDPYNRGPETATLSGMPKIDTYNDRRAVISAMLLGVPLGWVLLLGALLREEQCFWMDEGGVPRLVRAAVEHGFMPAVAAAALLLLRFTLRQRMRPGRRAPLSTPIHREPVAWLWLGFAAVLCTAAADNLINVAVGLPLHHQASAICCGA